MQTLTSTCLVFHAGCFLTLTAAAAFLLADFRPAEASPWRQTWCQPSGIADYWRMKFHSLWTTLCVYAVLLEWMCVCVEQVYAQWRSNEPIDCLFKHLYGEMNWVWYQRWESVTNQTIISLGLHICLCISKCAYVWMHIKVSILASQFTPRFWKEGEGENTTLCAPFIAKGHVVSWIIMRRRPLIG